LLACLFLNHRNIPADFQISYEQKSTSKLTGDEGKNTSPIKLQSFHINFYPFILSLWQIKYTEYLKTKNGKFSI